MIPIMSSITLEDTFLEKNTITASIMQAPSMAPATVAR